MQSNSDNNSVTAAMVAALVTRKPAANETASHNTMRAYLDKLRDLVPHCPKNRNVSKLELIQHVIDYINDLQETLQNSTDPDSPPASPSTPLSFTEAFSHLSFNEDGSLRGVKASPSYDESPSPTGYSAAAYTSDGASDYDSRGSSPINNSDTDYSSDEYSPTQYPHPYAGPFYTNSLTLQLASHPTPSTSFSSTPTAAPVSDPRRFFRKGYGLPAHLSG